ncbi:hypothetical protein Nepgr_004745 [Nepenthes gracilis]|uniref:C2H2-type domain-containing protein n=1 Tax=Nepenthes gracilis TaxID=150966 RepID=A0AAD3S1X3_NEPGR|nr:hypothetical protein Nepgr_004745 [Nepenthes gracilis]
METPLDFSLSPPIPTGEFFADGATTFPFPNTPTATTDSAAAVLQSRRYRQNPTKKRTEFLLIEPQFAGTSCRGILSPNKAKTAKKPDPSAPKITRPCSECGKRFWSWKALFGHMRCHPERQWRGINPPPQFRRGPSPSLQTVTAMTEEDHQVAACLLMMANGNNRYEIPVSAKQSITETEICGRKTAMSTRHEVDAEEPSNAENRFERSSCLKTISEPPQSLGGANRTSYKNVKGFFPFTKSGATAEVKVEDGGNEGGDGGEEMVMVLGGHQCSICLRVFSSGQALGGHKRCHWERSGQQFSMLEVPRPCRRLDLNLPADPLEDGWLSSSFSPDLQLDLKLGI